MIDTTILERKKRFYLKLKRNYSRKQKENKIRSKTNESTQLNPEFIKLSLERFRINKKNPGKHSSIKLPKTARNSRTIKVPLKTNKFIRTFRTNSLEIRKRESSQINMLNSNIKKKVNKEVIKEKTKKEMLKIRPSVRRRNWSRMELLSGYKNKKRGKEKIFVGDLRLVTKDSMPANFNDYYCVASYRRFSELQNLPTPNFNKICNLSVLEKIKLTKFKDRFKKNIAQRRLKQERKDKRFKAPFSKSKSTSIMGFKKKDQLKLSAQPSNSQEKTEKKDKQPITKSKLINQMASIEMGLNVPAGPKPRHTRFRGDSIQIHIPKLEDECKMFVSYRIEHEKERLFGMSHITQQNVYEKSKLVNQIIFSDDSSSLKSIRQRKSKFFEFNLDFEMSCMNLAKGYFKMAKPPKYYKYSKVYHSYWMDCIENLIDNASVIKGDDLGYYTLLTKNYWFKVFREDIETYKRNPLVHNEFEYENLNTYEFLKKIEFDLIEEHSGFILSHSD